MFRAAVVAFVRDVPPQPVHAAAEALLGQS
jgi:hypothetical protein